MLKEPLVRLPFFCCGKRMVLKEACVCFIGACDREAGAVAAWRAKQGSKAQAQSSGNACISGFGKPTKLSEPAMFDTGAFCDEAGAAAHAHAASRLASLRVTSTTL